MTVLILCGFWPHATDEALAAFRAEHPDLRVVSGGNAAPGDDPAVALVRHLPADGDAPLIVTAPPACEPDDLRTAWRARGGGGSLSVATVVPADLLLDGVTDETPLEAVGMHLTVGDPRSIAEVVCRQIEQADTVLVAGRPDGDDEWEAEQLRVLVRGIAPWSQQRGLDDVRLPDAGRRTPLAPVTRGLRGQAVGLHEPLPDHGVVAAVFHARRPFHPGRLHDALDGITDWVLRSRGHFWLASILAGCLLTDEELSQGEVVWRRWPDPFARFKRTPPRTSAPRR